MPAVLGGGVAYSTPLRVRPLPVELARPNDASGECYQAAQAYADADRALRLPKTRRMMVAEEVRLGAHCVAQFVEELPAVFMPPGARLMREQHVGALFSQLAIDIGKDSGHVPAQTAGDGRIL